MTAQRAKGKEPGAKSKDNCDSPNALLLALCSLLFTSIELSSASLRKMAVGETEKWKAAIIRASKLT